LSIVQDVQPKKLVMAYFCMGFGHKQWLLNKLYHSDAYYR